MVKGGSPSPGIRFPSQVGSPKGLIGTGQRNGVSKDGTSASRLRSKRRYRFRDPCGSVCCCFPFFVASPHSQVAADRANQSSEPDASSERSYYVVSLSGGITPCFLQRPCGAAGLRICRLSNLLPQHKFRTWVGGWTIAFWQTFDRTISDYSRRDSRALSQRTRSPPCGELECRFCIDSVGRATKSRAKSECERQRGLIDDGRYLNRQRRWWTDCLVAAVICATRSSRGDGVRRTFLVP